MSNSRTRKRVRARKRLDLAPDSLTHARERGRNYSPVPQGRAFLSGRGLPFSGRHFSNTTREEARV